MATTYHAEITAVDHEVWSGDVEFVAARTTEGEIGILAGHIPLLGELVAGGVVKLVTEGTDVLVAVHGGFLSVTDRGVQILAEVAELGSEVDVARAERALQAATAAEQDDVATAATLRALARLRAAGREV